MGRARLARSLAVTGQNLWLFNVASSRVLSHDVCVVNIYRGRIVELRCIFLYIPWNLSDWCARKGRVRGYFDVHFRFETQVLCMAVHSTVMSYSHVRKRVSTVFLFGIPFARLCAVRVEALVVVWNTTYCVLPRYIRVLALEKGGGAEGNGRYPRTNVCVVESAETRLQKNGLLRDKSDISYFREAAEARRSRRDTLCR